MDAGDFWEVMDTSEVTREEMALLARYLVEPYKSEGFRVPAENFLKEAQLDQGKELEGSYMDYHLLWMKHGQGMLLFPFFCQEKLKELRGLDTLKRSTYQEPDPDIDPVRTFSCEEPPSVKERIEYALERYRKRKLLYVAPISNPQIEAFQKLSKYVQDYFNKNVFLADVFLEINQSKEAEPF